MAPAAVGRMAQKRKLGTCHICRSGTWSRSVGAKAERAVIVVEAQVQPGQRDFCEAASGRAWVSCVVSFSLCEAGGGRAEARKMAMRVLVYRPFSSLQGGGRKMRFFCLAWDSASFGAVHLKASGAGAALRPR